MVRAAMPVRAPSRMPDADSMKAVSGDVPRHAPTAGGQRGGARVGEQRAARTAAPRRAGLQPLRPAERAAQLWLRPAARAAGWPCRPAGAPLTGNGGTIHKEGGGLAGEPLPLHHGGGAREQQAGVRCLGGWARAWGGAARSAAIRSTSQARTGAQQGAHSRGRTFWSTKLGMKLDMKLAME